MTIKIYWPSLSRLYMLDCASFMLLILGDLIWKRMNSADWYTVQIQLTVHPIEWNESKTARWLLTDRTFGITTPVLRANYIIVVVSSSKQKRINWFHQHGADTDRSIVDLKRTWYHLQKYWLLSGKWCDIISNFCPASAMCWHISLPIDSVCFFEPVTSFFKREVLSKVKYLAVSFSGWPN